MVWAIRDPRSTFITSTPLRRFELLLALTLLHHARKASIRHHLAIRLLLIMPSFMPQRMVIDQATPWPVVSPKRLSSGRAGLSLRPVRVGSPGSLDGIKEMRASNTMRKRLSGLGSEIGGIKSLLVEPQRAAKRTGSTITTEIGRIGGREVGLAVSSDGHGTKDRERMMPRHVCTEKRRRHCHPTRSVPESACVVMLNRQATQGEWMPAPQNTD